MGEFTAGLSVLSILEVTGVQGIVTRLSGEYFKKAKGTITGVVQVDPTTLVVPAGEEQANVDVVTDLFNSKNELVARVVSSWTLRRREPKKKQ